MTNPLLEKMQKNLTQLLLNAAPKRIDPAVFQDPLAIKTDWTPLSANGGSNFKTKTLKKVSGHRLEYHISIVAIVFCGMFILWGSLFGAAILYAQNHITNHRPPPPMAVLLIPAIFVGVGFFLMRQLSQTFFFDLPTNTFGKGSAESGQRLCSLHEIGALQIIPQGVVADRRNYVCYEFNLVLNSGQRINVIKHSNLKSIRQDAEQIKELLARRIPLWDATLPQYYIDKAS